MSMSLFRRPCSQHGRAFGLGLVSLAFCFAGLVFGCQTTFENAIIGDDGPVTLQAISAILDDTSLDDAERRQALRDLGITDEELIDVLTRSQ